MNKDIEYEKKVKKAQENNSSETIKNSSTEHAKILIKFLIKDANKSIKILSDNFEDKFYEEIKEDMISFLKKSDHKIELIISNKKSKDKHTILKELETINNFSCKMIHIDLFPNSYKDDEKVNFIVTDNNSYRFEYSDVHYKEDRVDAIASYNNQDNALTLNENFDSLLKYAPAQSI